ncbi:MAG: tryptophan 2,3-dioxygenase [Chitinophagales bacterium]|nr:tryptophan 2,3-dioxygenase [Chitinophagales bacterium]
MNNEIYYSDYLQLEKILQAQAPESEKAGVNAHDEMLFIITHQTYELWFKQILYELSAVMAVMAQPHIRDNSPDLFTAVHRLKRVVTIFLVLIHQIDILETMTPLDFLDFRNMLRPASGFQSMQFKILEATLGLRLQERHGREYYTSQLRPEDKKKIEELEQKIPLVELVNIWLERMPFFDVSEYWGGQSYHPAEHPFWKTYRSAYATSLLDIEKNNLERMDELLFSSEKKSYWKLSPKARRAALFIIAYRDFPLLQLPFQLLNVLLEIDESLATWRYRHMNMVHRMIGTRVGTGGSTGKEYLRGTVEKHYIFSEIAEITSFMIERSKLPQLSPELQKKLGFEQ